MATLLDRLAQDAYERGSDAADNHAPNHRESPLSAEWAGESIPELLGDLLETAEAAGIDSSEAYDEITNGYITGYEEAASERPDGGAAEAAADRAEDAALYGNLYGFVNTDGDLD